MSDDNVIPFPRPPVPPERALHWSDGRVQTTCDDIAHVFAGVPGRCQCGKNFWDGGPSIPPGVGIYDPTSQA